MTCERKCSNDFSKLPSKTKDDLLRDYANAIQDIARVVENCSESPDMYLILKVCERIKEFELFVFSDRSNSELSPESIETVEMTKEEFKEKFKPSTESLLRNRKPLINIAYTMDGRVGYSSGEGGLMQGIQLVSIEHPKGSS